MVNRKKMRKQLIQHEGLRLKPYQCPGGYWTIGVGRNLEGKGISSEELVLLLKKGITKSQAMMLLDHDIKECIEDLESIFPDFKEFNGVRQRVLVDMRFNLGPSRFKRFKRMIGAVRKKDFARAAHEMLGSRWAGQTGKRAERLARMMREGK